MLVSKAVRKIIAETMRKTELPFSACGSFYDNLEYFERVVNYALPYYQQSLDKAHDIDHAIEVCLRALDMNLKLGLNQNEYMIIVAAIMHDMASGISHDTHEVIAAEFIRSDDFKESRIGECYSDDILNKIATAILEHRASFSQDREYSSVLSELIASADRDKPSLPIIVRRAVHYANGDVDKAYNHIKHKYGSNGYAKYPKIYKDYYGAQYGIFITEVDNMKIEYVETLAQILQNRK